MHLVVKSVLSKMKILIHFSV